MVIVSRFATIWYLQGLTAQLWYRIAGWHLRSVTKLLFAGGHILPLQRVGMCSTEPYSLWIEWRTSRWTLQWDHRPYADVVSSKQLFNHITGGRTKDRNGPSSWYNAQSCCNGGRDLASCSWSQPLNFSSSSRLKNASGQDNRDIFREDVPISTLVTKFGFAVRFTHKNVLGIKHFES